MNTPTPTTTKPLTWNQWARKMTTAELKAEARSLFEMIEISDCFGTSDLRAREAVEAELYRRGVTCNESRTLTFEDAGR